MAVDKPIVQFSIANLKKEVARPDTFRISLSGSKTITFPDLMAMESEESDELLARIEKLDSTWGVLDDWLSKNDAASLRAEKLSRAELLHVVKVAAKYYQDAYGTEGEGDASAS
jgi:hypothetical protein